MNKIAKLILTLILTATVGLVNAQKWQKSIDKINASYETGNYPKADKAIQKLKSKSIKKLGSPNKYQAMAIIKEAKNNVALGIFSNVDNLIRSGIAPIEYSVSPYWNPQILGGKPIEYFSTLIPNALAASKCPNSCNPTNIDSPNKSWATMINTSIN